MEIVSALSGDLIIPTSIIFLNLISSIDTSLTCQEKLVIKKILCKITFDNTALMYKQHDLAVAAIMLVRGDPTFSLMNGRFKYTDYIECMRHIYDIMALHSLFDSSMSTVKKFRYSPSTKPVTAVRSMRYVKQNNPVELSNLQLVNHGSFGQVYRAITGNNETVALKVQKGSDSYQSMLLDIILLSSLKDNNVEDIKSVYVDHEEMSFSMPYRNLDLHRLITINLSSYQWSDVYSNMSIRPQNTIDYSIRRSIMMGVLKGISYIHSMGVIHRDIKPGNVLIDNLLNPKITDFGLSKSYVVGPDHHCGGRYGNDAYSPPDRFVSQASDMWAVGMCLLELEMCTFATEFRTVKDLRDAHKIMISKNGLRMVKDLPVRRLLLQLLDYDPNRRISSQQALVSFN